MAATIRIQVQSAGGLDKIKADLSSLGDSAKGAGAGFTSLQKVATGALLRVGEMAVNAAAQAAQAFVSFAKDGIKAAGDFEAGMNSFAAVAGDSLDDSGKSLEDFKDLFISLGRELPVSTAEVQQAAIELAKGGIDPATIAAGGLRTALDMAAAGGVGLAESATIMAKQLGVWVDQAADAGTKSKFLAESADLIAQAANASTVDVHELSLGLANVGGQAKASGLTFRETVTTMALVSSGFSSAADAGTSFKTFLSRLQPTTESQADAMRDLNLLTAEGKSIFYDATGSFIGMEQTASILQDRLSGLSDAEKIAALNAIFGADAFRVAAQLADKGAEGYAAMAEAMQKAGGVAQQAAARQQGFNVAVDNMMGSLEALQITVGTALLPTLTDFVNLIADGINAVTSYADATLQGETALSTIASILSDAVLPAIAAVTTALIAYSVAALAPALVNMNAMIAVAILATKAFVAQAVAVAAAAAPFIVIGAAVAGAVLIWQKLNQTVKDATTQLLESRQWWNDAAAAIQNYGAQTGEAQIKLKPYAETIRVLREQIQGEIEDLGKRQTAGLVSEAQFQREMDAINAKRAGLIQVTAAYNKEEQAILAEAAAGMTATNIAAQMQDQTALLGSQVSLTAEDVNKLGDAIKKNMQDGATALGTFATNYATFKMGMEQRATELKDRIAELEKQKREATTAEQKLGFDEQIVQAQIAYGEQEAAAAQSYAEQQAAQRQHLGQMLIDYTVSQAMLGNIAKDKAAEITAALEKEYGLQQSSSATTYLNMTQDIDNYAKSAGGSVDDLIGHLQANEQSAKDTEAAMTSAAKEYVMTQTNNFLEGKMSADEYTRALENIPKEIRTKVITEYESRGDNVAAGGVSGYRAAGGPVRQGKAYVVGEEGPELFVPDSNGNIVSNTTTNNRSLTLNYAPTFGGGRNNAQRDYGVMAALARSFS